MKMALPQAYAASALAAMGMLASSPAWAVDFSTGCIELYTGSCNGGDPLNDACDVTDNMATELTSRWSWTWVYDKRNGQVESRAYEDDDKDGNGDGEDENVFDQVGSADLAVFSGHGTYGTGGVEPNGRWTISAGTPWGGNPASDRYCQARAPFDMVFGEQGTDPYSGDDGDAEYVVMDASCSAIHTSTDHGEVDEVYHASTTGVDDGIMGRVHQAFAFGDSPCDKPGRLKDWVIDIDNGSTNKAAWLDKGSQCPIGKDAHPTAVTKDDSDCTTRANSERMESPGTDPAFDASSYCHSYVSYTGTECGL